GIDRPLRNGRGVSSDEIENDETEIAEHSLDLCSAPKEDQQVETDVDQPRMNQRRSKRRQERRYGDPRHPETAQPRGNEPHRERRLVSVSGYDSDHPRKRGDRRDDV